MHEPSDNQNMNEKLPLKLHNAAQRCTANVRFGGVVVQLRHLGKCIGHGRRRSGGVGLFCVGPLVERVSLLLL